MTYLSNPGDVATGNLCLDVNQYNGIMRINTLNVTRLDIKISINNELLICHVHNRGGEVQLYFIHNF
jgi:hypothetical protein